MQVLLLSSSSIEPHQKQDTLSQLRQFASSSASAYTKKALAFLLSEDAFSSASGKHSLNGLLALQVFLFESLANPLPVVPIADASSFLSSIQEYMANLADIPTASPSLADSVALLAHATSNERSGTLSEQTTNILSDLFPSFRLLSRGIRTSEGRDLLEDYLGIEEARKLIRFWDEDILRE